MDPLLVEKKGAVLAVTLNRPDALNSFTVPLMEGLHKALKDAAKDASVRVVSLTGAGRGFCVGQDLKEHLDRKPSFRDDLRERFNPLVLKIRALEKPVVAVVNGVAAGAGMSLALACDFRIASKAASFHTAFAKIGLAPDSANLFFLSRYAGAARALELEMTGMALSADEAFAWGVVNKVCAVEALAAESEAFVAALAAGPAKAYALTKRMFNEMLFAKDLATQLDSEALLQEIAGRTADHAEGLRAFVEKRAAAFTGT
jgi:2-(1,2-epoxy-1,2-dihydrophenyl)acetyl-CoA isomerase